MSAPAVVRANIPGKGIGLVAARDIAAGECVVRETRAVLSGVAESFRQDVCARCLSFRAVDGASPPPPCAGCGRVRLCGANGACAWDDLGHGPVACAAETLARDLALARADAERLRFHRRVRGPTSARASRPRARRRSRATRRDGLLCPEHDGPPPARDLAAANRLRDLLARAAAASRARARRRRHRRNRRRERRAPRQGGPQRLRHHGARHAERPRAPRPRRRRLRPRLPRQPRLLPQRRAFRQLRRGRLAQGLRLPVGSDSIPPPRPTSSDSSPSIAFRWERRSR